MVDKKVNCNLVNDQEKNAISIDSENPNSNTINTILNNSNILTMNLNNLNDTNSMSTQINDNSSVNSSVNESQSNNSSNTVNTPVYSSVINSTLNNTISQQIPSNQSNIGVQSNHIQQSNNLINSTTVSNFIPISNNATSVATTANLNNFNNPINSNNSTINPNVAASCPTANNIINQSSIQLSNSTIMNRTTSNSVSNLDLINQDDSEDESEILEESPCGRWLKRREEVEQRDIPGIDATFLAMDTEEGVEVVWNEVRFSERKYFNSKEETICEVFDRLILLNHPNIVKLHKYWIDKDAEKARIIFITEYMSSGSVKLFLKKTKKNEIKMSLNAWKRWCKQLLSALCYLHSSQPPIIHENLTCDTVFISHNGLIKMGAVAPNAIHQHIKTVADDSMSNIYLVAPEIMNLTDDINTVLTPAVDIYSFGMCALEMAALEISSNGESSQITKENVEKTIESLDNELQKDFIRKCLAENPADRLSAKDLLFHPVIFEVPSLALLTAHSILNNNSSFSLTDETFQRNFNNLNDATVLAEIVHPDGRPGVVRRICDIPQREVEKFFEEVRNGAYPLTAIFPATRQPIISRQTTISPEPSGSGNEQKNSVPENPYNEENRKIVNMMCNIKAPQENENLMMTLLLRLDDKMNRQLSCEITDIESPICLANELVYYGFINQSDRDMVAALINDTISRTQFTKSDTSASVTLHQAATTTA